MILLQGLPFAWIRRHLKLFKILIKGKKCQKNRILNWCLKKMQTVEQNASWWEKNCLRLRDPRNHDIYQIFLLFLLFFSNKFLLLSRFEVHSPKRLQFQDILSFFLGYFLLFSIYPTIWRFFMVLEGEHYEKMNNKWTYSDKSLNLVFSWILNTLILSQPILLQISSRSLKENIKSFFSGMPWKFHSKFSFTKPAKEILVWGTEYHDWFLISSLISLNLVLISVRFGFFLTSCSGRSSKSGLISEKMQIEN